MRDSDNIDDSTQSHIILAQGVMVLQYRVLGKIGAGGMGEVYLAEDTKLDRRVALKFLPSQFANDGEVRSRFTREAQAAAKLVHPNIITIYEVGEFNGRPFFAMEFVTGNSLGHFCREIKLSISETIMLAIQICEGLSKAHQMGIVHRDIKPANIVIDSENRPKILDFGLAAVQGADTLTKPGSTLGTIAYMSPEQAQGKSVDQRSDIFSFGVVLYELVTGQAPFKRDSDPATLQAIVSDDPEPLARFRANVSSELQRIITKLLERDPGLRYQTASDVIADLKKLAISGNQLRVRPVRAKQLRIWVYLGSIVIIAVVSAIFLRMRASKGIDSSRTEMTITPITNDGKVTTAAISPDGTYLSYATDDSGRQSVWIQHLSSGGKVQVVDTTNVTLQNLSFSPDGNFVYFRLMRGGDLGDLFRVPVLGGSSHQILPNVWSKVTFSPGGARIAFWRVTLSTMAKCVVTANADGTEERELVANPADDEKNFSIEPAWSPDGKVIAISKTVLQPSTQTMLAMLDATTGKEVWQISGNWVGNLSLAWQPADGLIVSAIHHTNPFGQQIWQVAYPEGTIRRITNDLNDYTEVSLTADGNRLAVVQKDTRAGVWLVPIQDANNAKQILDGKYDGLGGISWADSNSLVFFTRTANDYCLSRNYIDRGKQEIVIRGNPIVLSPSAAREKQKVIYCDIGENYSQISICDLDGRNRKSITANGEYNWPDISSDGNWAVYCDFEKGYPRIIRTSIQGEASFPLDSTGSPHFEPSISPDGRWVACYTVDLSTLQVRIAILPAEGGGPVHLLDVPLSIDAGFTKLVWSVDGSSIFYQDLKNGVSNIWNQPIAGGTPRQITHFRDLYINDFDLSLDGKNLAVCRSRSTSDVVLIEGFQ